MANPPIRPGWNARPEAVVAKDPKNFSTKVSFVPGDFKNLIANHGVRARVFRTMLCPRVRSVDGREHDINCPLCRGAQFIDRYPLETKCVVSTQAENKMTEGPAREGFIDGNTAYATFDLGVDLQYFTLVELMDFYDGFQQRIRRQEGDLDVLRYTARQINVLVDYEGRDYKEGLDFKVSPDGNVLWCSGDSASRPARGTVYSIHYDSPIRFRATRAVHVNRFASVREGSVDRMVQMPVQWEVTRDFLVSRKDLDGNERPDNVLREPRDLDDGYEPL